MLTYDEDKTDLNDKPIDTYPYMTRGIIIGLLIVMVVALACWLV